MIKLPPSSASDPNIHAILVPKYNFEMKSQNNIRIRSRSSVMITLCNPCKNEPTEPQWLKKDVKGIKGRWKDGRWHLDKYFRQHCAAKQHSSTSSSREQKPEVKYCSTASPSTPFYTLVPTDFVTEPPCQKSPELP